MTQSHTPSDALSQEQRRLALSAAERFFNVKGRYNGTDAIELCRLAVVHALQSLPSEREASLSKALDLLQACRMCDLVYDWNDRAVGDFPGSDGKAVYEVVDEFLKEHGRE